jgi:hypothetical protein
MNTLEALDRIVDKMPKIILLVCLGIIFATLIAEGCAEVRKAGLKITADERAWGGGDE